MPRPIRLLVTGFGPFPRMPRNPSAALALSVAAAPRLRLNAIEARGVVLTTAYATLPGELDPLLAERPDVVLMIGVAGRAAKVRVEGRATSRRSTLFPDARGDTPDRPEARRHSGRTAIRHTGANVVAALADLKRHGLPARPSRDAGRYLCNAAYFRALARSAPTLFIHIPKTPAARPLHRCRKRKPGFVGASWNRALACALVDTTLGMARDARRVAGGPISR